MIGKKRDKNNRRDTGRRKSNNQPIYEWNPNSDKIADNDKTISNVKDDFNQEEPHNNLLLEAPPQRELTKEFCYEISEWLVDNIDRNDVIMGTVHGSYLYGTAHKDSDLDLYVVVEKGKNKSKVLYGQDVQIMNLETFIRNASEGSHQAVEALNSPYKVFNDDSPYKDYIDSLRPSPYNFVKKCRSAGKAFYHKGLEENNAKKLRHAKRLNDAADAMINGTYSPVWKNIEEPNEW